MCPVCPHRLTKELKGYSYENGLFFLKKKRCQNCYKSRIIELLTVDGTWIYRFEPQRGVNYNNGCAKIKLSLPPQKKNARGNVLNAIFFEFRLSHCSSAKALKVKGTFYKNNVVSKMEKNNIDLRGVCLIYDTAVANHCKLVHYFLETETVVQLHNPHYSPELSPCDFFLFFFY